MVISIIKPFGAHEFDRGKYMSVNGRLNRTALASVLVAVAILPFYFIRLNILGFKTNLPELIIIGAGVLLLVSKYRDMRGKAFSSVRSLSKEFIFPLLFVLTAVVSSVIAEDKMHAIGILKGWFVVPVLLFIIIVNLFTTKTIYKLTWAVWVSALTVTAWGLLQIVFRDKVVLPHQALDPDLINFLKDTPIRVSSFFESPNYVPMFLAPAFFLSLPLLRIVRNWYARGLLIITFALMAVVIYSANSRSGLLAFIVPAAYMIARTLYSKKSVLRTFILTIILLILAGFTFYSIHTWKHANSTIGRARIYAYSERLVQNHPIAGIGLGDFNIDMERAAHNDQEFLVYYLPYAYHPHNLYLAIWLNLGIAGLAMFLLCITVFFNNLSTTGKQEFTSVALGCAMATILIHGIFDTPYFKNDLSIIFWLIYAYMYVLHMPDKNLELEK